VRRRDHLVNADNSVDGSLVFVDTIVRNTHVRSFLLGRLLGAHSHSFETYDRMAAIVGDPIADIIRRFGRYEDFQLRAIDTLILSRLPCKQLYCLDVGANIGNHSLFFSRYFAQVVAFEPGSVACTLLELNLAMNDVDNVEVQPVGLSDRAGTAKYSVNWKNLGGSYVPSLGKPKLRSELYDVNDVDIDLVPGDSILDPDSPVGFVKIDVEGMESHVLRGLDRTIDRYRPVIMLEQLPSAVDEKTGSTEASILLENKGYRTFEIRRVVRARSKLVNDILTYLFGSIHYVLVPVRTFEKRIYPVLLFLTEDLIKRIWKRE
jgi:FkbM family methyltransferase